MEYKDTHINTYDTRDFCIKLAQGAIRLPSTTKSYKISDSDVLIDKRGIIINRDQIYRDEVTKFILKNFLSESNFIDTSYINKFIPLVFRHFETNMQCYWQEFIKNKEIYKPYQTIENIITFYLKGGNLTKIYVNQLQNLLKEFEMKYDFITSFNEKINRFKLSNRSDFDFAITINMQFFKSLNAINDYQKIYNDMKILSFYTLENIRRELIGDFDKYFYYNKASELTKNIESKQLIKNINAQIINSPYIDTRTKKCVGFKFNDYNYGISKQRKKFDIIDFKSKETISITKNMFIDREYEKRYFEDKIISETDWKGYNKEWTIEKPFDYETGYFFDEFMSSNSPFIITLYEANETEMKEIMDFEYPILQKIKDVFINNKTLYHTKFDLLRLRICFMICLYDTLTQKLEYRDVLGELIDVAISYIDPVNDELGKDALMIFQHDDFIEKIAIVDDTGNQFFFNVVSHKYQLHDLDTILFNQPPNPWADKKYDKRLLRYFILYIIDSAGFDIIDDRIAYLKSVKSILDKLINNMQPNGYDVSNILLQMKNLPNEKMNMYELFKFMQTFIKKHSTNNILNIDATLISEFKLFLVNCSNYIEYVTNVLLLVKENNINMDERIKAFKKNTLFGGNANKYEAKYIKYKHKYIASKKFVKL